MRIEAGMKNAGRYDDDVFALRYCYIHHRVQLCLTRHITNGFNDDWPERTNAISDKGE